MSAFVAIWSSWHCIYSFIVRFIIIFSFNFTSLSLPHSLQILSFEEISLFSLLVKRNSVIINMQVSYCRQAHKILTFLIVAMLFLVMLSILLSAKLLQSINELLRHGCFTKLDYSTRASRILSFFYEPVFHAVLMHYNSSFVLISV